VAQAECLPSNLKSWVSNPNTFKNKEKRKLHKFCWLLVIQPRATVAVSTGCALLKCVAFSGLLTQPLLECSQFRKAPISLSLARSLAFSFFIGSCVYHNIFWFCIAKSASLQLKPVTLILISLVDIVTSQWLFKHQNRSLNNFLIRQNITKSLNLSTLLVALYATRVCGKMEQNPFSAQHRESFLLWSLFTNDLALYWFHHAVKKNQACALLRPPDHFPYQGSIWGRLYVSDWIMSFYLLGEHGDYFRLLLPGTYAVTATAPGFDPQTVSVIVGPAEPALVSLSELFRAL
jgi:hypothetical protein